MFGSCHLGRVLNFWIGVEFWMFIYFFVFSLIEKVGQIALQFSLWSYPTFSKPYRWPKMCFISKQIIWYSTQISTFDALSKWHDPCITIIDSFYYLKRQKYSKIQKSEISYFLLFHTCLFNSSHSLDGLVQSFKPKGETYHCIFFF